MDFKDKVRLSVNLLELVSEYTKMTPSGVNSWSGRCPHPDHEDKNPSFHVWKSKDTNEWSWCCMGCHCGKTDVSGKYKNYGADCFGFIRWISDYKGSKHILSFPESIKYLADKVGLHYESGFDSREYKLMSLRAKAYHVDLTKQVLKYLYKRGLSDEDINKWKIGATTTKYGYRIMFPLFDRHKEVRGFSSRILNEDENPDFPKYINSRERPFFHKREYLYGLQNLDDTCSELRITEGVFDVILADKYNVKNIVCTLGTALTEDHVKLIKSLNKTPCFCLDGDEAGRRGTYKAIKLLAEHDIYSKVCILPEGMDMAQLANREKDNLENYIQTHSILYWQYLLQDLATQYESRVNEIRMKMLPDIAKIYDNITSTTSEKIMINNYIEKKFGFHL